METEQQPFNKNTTDTLVKAEEADNVQINKEKKSGSKVKKVKNYKQVSNELREEILKRVIFHKEKLSKVTNSPLHPLSL